MCWNGIVVPKKTLEIAHPICRIIWFNAHYQSAMRKDNEIISEGV